MRVRLRLAAALPPLFLPTLCLPSQADAQDASQKGAEEPVGEEIIVRAPAGDRTLIDRETYLVRDTPLAQTKPAVEVIQNLPSVSVDASGQLRLLGSKNVKILIDGRDVPNANSVIGTLQASQIARIEVVTNPSAQYSAYGSAGIINIILRRRFVDGVGGSASITAGNPRHLSGRLSPTWSRGKWSLSASPSLSTSDSHTRSRLERTFETQTGLSRTEIQKGRGVSRTAAATAQASFERNESERYDLTGSLTRASGRNTRSADISSPVNAFAPFVELSSGRSALDAESLSLERTTKGSRAGEELKLSLSWSRYDISGQNTYLDQLGSTPTAVRIATATAATNGALKADFTLPMGKSDTLSLGAEATHERQRTGYFADGSLLSGPVFQDDEFAGRSLDVSAFATLQTRLASVKILPGLRVQTRRFEFERASGLAPVTGTLLFPSLHVERPFGKVIATFSIAKRADWPSIPQFQPVERVTGPTTVETGNPDLRPERTLNIEAAARVSIGAQNLSAKIYRRRRSSVRDTALTLTDEGDVLSTPINVGTRLSQGGQVSIRGKLSSQWQYSASGWFAMARYNAFDGVALARQETTEYGGNGRLEYSSAKQGTRGFQQATLNVRYQGPVRTYQEHVSGLLSIDIDYTRNLTDRLSLVASVSRAIGGRTISIERSGPRFRENIRTELYGPIVRFSLNYRFGKTAQ
jgi:outer membrane receptor for ferrienterochelin and colicin